MNLQDLTLKGFLAATYGKDPVPGGGSVSALCGALSASLAEMVTALTLGRKKYVDVEEEMKALAPSLEKARISFLDFIDKDAEAYNCVFSAFKLPKETDEEKTARAEAIETATIKAADVPLAVAETALSIMPTIAAIAKKGNQNAITDACVAMMCARTCALGALLNVRINLTSLINKELAEKYASRCDKIQIEVVELETALLSSVKI